MKLEGVYNAKRDGNPLIGVTYPDDVMSRLETETVIEKIERVIDYFRKEFHLSNAEAIGCLRTVKYGIHGELREESEK